MESTDHHRRVVDRRSEIVDPDEKVERFYALIREERNRRRIEIERSAAAPASDRGKKRSRVEEEGGGWIPAFKWEDFRDVEEIGRPKVDRDVEIGRQETTAGEEDEKVPIEIGCVGVPKVDKGLELDLKLHL